MNNDINNYMPSLLNPRTALKTNNLNCTQASVSSRVSLSLRRNRRNQSKTTVPSTSKAFSQFKNTSVTGKENFDLNNFQRKIRPAAKSRNSSSGHRKNISLQNSDLDFRNSNSVILMKCSFENSLPKSNNVKSVSKHKTTFNQDLSKTKNINTSTYVENNGLSKLCSLEFSEKSLVDDIDTVIIGDTNNNSGPFTFEDFEYLDAKNTKIDELIGNFLTESSNTEIVSVSNDTVVSKVVNDLTQTYDITEKNHISVSFEVTDCDILNLSTKKSNIKNIQITNTDNNVSCDCVIVESSQISTESEIEEGMNTSSSSPLKRSAAVEVNLEIKKHKTTTENNDKDKSRVLILNTDAIDKLSHVIIQPPNLKLVKRQSFGKGKLKRKSIRQNVKGGSGQDKLKQISLDRFFNREITNVPLKEDKLQDVEQEMSRNRSPEVEAGKIRVHKSSGTNESPLKARGLLSRKNEPQLRQEIKTSSSETPRIPSPKRKTSPSLNSPKRAVESLQFNVPAKPRPYRTSTSAKQVPNYKIVAGTQFAVDAFSYGEISNVRHYFLTHFHSDHYSGLKKTFNKTLFCSKITADLCVSRLGVNMKHIHIIDIDETIIVDGIEVTAVDANHCPGAIMLVFTLPNQKTILHTGDFRATPTMESYPVFWNKDIHTVYLDTTYCDPRYDFPTQEQSLDMAMSILRQKKMAVEKEGRKFSSVLIICGTYTIGKEKFFLGISQLVGCHVWACPEKDRVLRTVEGRSFTQKPPHACQLHVVPMRDLTHEKLRSYLDTLHGTYTEVVAFKPSGWESGKAQAVEKDAVTIYGIPYSEHSSFSEMVRFIKFLLPKQVVPTVDISGGVKAVQKYFPCPLVYKEDLHSQSKLTDYYSIQSRQQVSAVT